MGIWSATSTAAGGALQRERWHGTLELLVAAPAHFSLVLLPMTIAMATIGLYSMAATLCLGAGPVRHPRPHRALAALLPVGAGTVISIGMLGFLLAVSFVRYRTAWALGNLLEYPVWLICGFLVPLDALPRLGAADLVGAGADLGHAARSASRPRAATAASPDLRRSCRSGSAAAVYYGDRRSLVVGLQCSRAAARERARRSALDMNSSVRVFFVGGADSASGRCSAGSRPGSDPDLRRRADLPDPAVRLHRPGGEHPVGRVLRDRQRAPVRGDPVRLRDDEHDRGRALPADPRRRARRPRRSGSRSSSAGRCR